MLKLKIFIAIIFICSECTHTQLRWNTTHQASTLSQIYEQQVLDNLAMFIQSPDSLPSFAYPNAGRSDVTDRGSVGSDTSWNRTGFAGELLRISGGRDLYETWGLSPVSDVRRLELMRCAYQHALWCSGICSNRSDCPNCDRIQRTFYIGDYQGSYVSAEEIESGLPDSLESFSIKTGRTTPACFQHVRWLACGKNPPSKCKGKCCKVGSYCGTYVWLCPGGQDELTKLTLTVLDYAQSSQALPPPRKPVPTKEVTWFFDKKGEPATQDDASQIIKAVLRLDEQAILRVDPEAVGTTSVGPGLLNDSYKDPAQQAFEKGGYSVSEKEYSLPLILTPRTGISPLELELQLRDPR